MKKSYLIVSISAILLASCSQNHNQNIQDHSRSIQQNQVVQRNPNHQAYPTIDKNEDFFSQLRSELNRTGARALNTNDVSILLNGMRLQVSPSPFIENETVYIPLSAVSTYFEVGVEYNKESETIGIHKGDQNIDFAIDSPIASLNGKTVSTVPAIKKGEDIFVPIDFVANSLGNQSQMNLEVKQVEIGNSQFSTLSGPDDSLKIFSTNSEYKVVAGDSLSLIAKRHNTTVDELQSLNKLTSNLIRVGQTLTVPSQVEAQQMTHTVVARDTLYSIAKRYNISVDLLKKWNNLSTDILSLGQSLFVSEKISKEPAPAENSTKEPASADSYTVIAGDTLYGIAKRYNTTAEELRRINQLSSDILRIGQTLIVSGQNGTQQPAQPAPAPTTPSQSQKYTVIAGDTLYGIARRFNTTPEELRKWNNLTSDLLQLGQVLAVSEQESSGNTPAPPAKQEEVTVKYITHTVKSGDNAWKLSVKYGVPMLELLKLNKLSLNSSLSIGQKLQIPVYTVPVKSVVSSKHGELLDWWTEGRYVFPIGKTVTITDFKTGRTFKVKHTMGGNHADSEPLTPTDAKIMKEIWGGSFSWTPRAIIISVDGRKLAAAMHSYPHADSEIKTNDYNGHFCIHFLNSTRHNDGLVQASMQKQVKIAAGVN